MPMESTIVEMEEVLIRLRARSLSRPTTAGGITRCHTASTRDISQSTVTLARPLSASATMRHVSNSQGATNSIGSRSQGPVNFTMGQLDTESLSQVIDARDVDAWRRPVSLNTGPNREPERLIHTTWCSTDPMPELGHGRA